eukprot:TRINITY_DN43336_c0_g1_i1.p1 TRINITY_DN43336_c0_g1~~TRINITY_DN43336_c0_g1_i1.p1  ORF type:complete len:669 (-),score=125.96 TRINITY_DN43336_c0_g1_i1:95-2101(-)
MAWISPFKPPKPKNPEYHRFQGRSANDVEQVMVDDVPRPRTLPLVSPVLFSAYALQNVSTDQTVANDPGYLLDIIEKDPGAFHYVPESLQKDMRFAMLVLAKHGQLLKYMTMEFQNDRRTVHVAIRQDGLALAYVDTLLIGELDINVMALRQNGLALKYSTYRDEYDVCVLAVSQNGLALQYTDDFKDDLRMAMLAVTGNPKAIELVGESLQNRETKEVLASHALYCALIHNDVDQAIAAIKMGGKYHYKNYAGLLEAASLGRTNMFMTIPLHREIDPIGLQICANMAKLRMHIELGRSLQQMADDAKKTYTEVLYPIQAPDFDKAKMVEASLERIANKSEELRQLKKADREPSKLTNASGNHRYSCQEIDKTTLEALRIKPRGFATYQHGSVEAGLQLWRDTEMEANDKLSAKTVNSSGFATTVKSVLVGFLKNFGLGAEPADHGLGPAHFAAKRGDVATLRKLAESGARLRDKTDLASEQLTPLHVAASHGQVAAIEEILAWVQKVDDLDFFKRTPMHHAAANGHTACVWMLLDAGARIDVTDVEGRTAIHAAVLGDHSDTLDSLLGSVNGKRAAAIADQSGLTPLQHVEQIEPVCCVQRLALLSVFERHGMVETCKQYMRLRITSLPTSPPNTPVPEPKPEKKKRSKKEKKLPGPPKLPGVVELS